LDLFVSGGRERCPTGERDRPIEQTEDRPMTRRSRRMPSFHGVALVASFVALGGGAAPLQAQDSLRATRRQRSIAEDLQLFSQVLNQIRVNHPDSLDTHELLMAAIEGMVSAADPHS